MNAWTRSACATLMLTCYSLAKAQSSAQISLAEGVYTAGDTIELILTFKEPATCNTVAYIQFTDGNQHLVEAGPSPVKTGETAMTMRYQLPRDTRAGEYKTSRAYLNPCPGYQYARDFTVPTTTLRINAYSDQIHYPESADVRLSLTQTQFLDTKIDELDSLDGKLTTAIERNAADLRPLRDLLIGTVKSAEDALTVTERQYQQAMKPQDTFPVFFADFHAQYQALQVQLNAPIPGTGKASAQRTPTLLYVQQLKNRTPDQGTKKPENLSNTYPMAVSAVRQTLKDNSSAYRIVRDTGKDMFDAQFISIPTGALISYRKLIDKNFLDYSSSTDVRGATFHLAYWTFKLHKEGCTDDQIKLINPFEDHHPVVSVEFSHCRAKQ